MTNVLHLPVYATGFRGDDIEASLQQLAPISLRYGATDFAVYRSRDDSYKFLQLASFESKLDFERYWLGDEFVSWRADYTSWFQVPVVYGFHEEVGRGALGGARETAADIA